MAGAQGELVEPIPSAKFTAECILSLKSEKELSAVTEIPDELRDWMNLASLLRSMASWRSHPTITLTAMKSDGYGATGDTMEEVVETMKGYADKLPDGVDADTDALVDLISEVKKEQEQGIEFTNQAIPEPETALNI